MGGKLNIYNLGDLGVVVDKSPIHEQDGELLRAQNAQVDSVGALGGIRKRDGLAKLNASALAGQVTGLLSLPLPDERTKVTTFLLALEPVNSNLWKSSTDGVSWSDVTTSPSRHVSSTNSGIESATTQIPSWNTIICSQGGKLYYPGNDYTNDTTAPNIHVWDGTTDATIATIPDNPATPAARPESVTSIVPYDETRLVVCTADRGTSPGYSRVFLLDTVTGKITQVGRETTLWAGWIVNGVCVFQGKIWVGGQNTSGGLASKVYYARPEDATWTLDNTFGTAHGYITGMAVFQGNLFVSFAADVGANGDVYQRTHLGVWTEVYASNGTGAGNNVSSLIVNADGTKMFAYQNKVSGGTTPLISILETSNGTVWSTSYDISANLSDSYTKPGAPLLDANGHIYWPLASGSAGTVGGLLKRTSAGVWSVILSALTNIRGPLGFVKTTT